MAVEHDSDDVSAFVKQLGIEAALFFEVVQGYHAELEEKETDAKVQQGLADFEDFNINTDLRRQVDEICCLQSERVAAIACADPVDANFPVDTALPAIANGVEESQWGAQTSVQCSVQSVTHVANEENPESQENEQNEENTENAQNEENTENAKNEETAANKKNEENKMDKVEEFIEAFAAGLPSWFTDENYVVPEAPEAPHTASSCVRRWGKRLEGEADEAAEAAETEQASHGRHWRETSHHHNHNSHNSHNSHDHDPWEGCEGSQNWQRSDGVGGAEGAGGWSDSHWQRDAQDDRWKSRRTSWQSQSWRESTDDWQSGGWRNSTWESHDWGSTGWHSNSFSIEFRSRFIKS